MAALFNEQFVETISHLRIVSKQVPQAGGYAEQASRQLGAGMEFRDFRSYMPGDDIRRIDWSLYQRSGKLFLRLYEELQDLDLHVLLDVSDSMFFEDPPRADAGRQMAAALVAAAINQHDAATVYPFGAERRPSHRCGTGRSGLMRSLEFLEGLGPAGPTDLPAAVRRLARTPLRSGLVAVVSDFFDPAGIASVVEALRGLRHRLLLVQLVRREDAAPAATGQLRLIDCESERDLDVTVTAEALESYRWAYQRFQDGLLAFVRGRGAMHVTVDADRRVLEQLSGLFVKGVLAAPRTF